MPIKIKHSVWKEELIIETDQGSARVSKNPLTGSLKIEGEEILDKIGMTVNEAMALFLDEAASPETKAKYANFMKHTKK
jgi:hypothetical protein